ncbi:hypothetical protein [Xanthomonas sp. XNM01]|uniref:hypothetical protein n=1 Tax=Xanthomonas sp. XNM01 TaxID=2769289 RepID=UPI0017817690|nr:hypothetical protein [Xanthomonas sp. XNM01]MBD9367470.1 hypothetical protein [Xanthomonas sp. XNM01]
MPDHEHQAPPRGAGYYVRNPWRNRATAGFAAASSLLTFTALFYAFGALPLLLVVPCVLLAVAAFGFGLYARHRAARQDAALFRELGR